MQEIVNLLPVLLVSVTMNLLAGLYYNIGTNDIKFDKAILIKGVIKAFIICSMFVGTAYCFEMTDLSAIGIEPKPIMPVSYTHLLHSVVGNPRVRRLFSSIVLNDELQNIKFTLKNSVDEQSDTDFIRCV